GIRDRNVTGVQTCALPIFWSRGCGLRARAAPAGASALRGRDPGHWPLRICRGGAERCGGVAFPRRLARATESRRPRLLSARDGRSEERRGGEGGGARGSRE